MGFGIKELLVVLVIVILLFGTKKLKNLGTDLGGAIRGFKKSMAEDGSEQPDEAVDDKAETGNLGRDNMRSETPVQPPVQDKDKA